MDLSKVKENFEKRGFKVKTFVNTMEANDFFDCEVRGKTVGIGGSMTVKEMGLYEVLKKHNQVYWHMGSGIKEEIVGAKAAEIYISSANALSEDGDIVNIDGFGNRLSAICHGAKKVFIVCGTNKICCSLSEAMFRAKNVAAPKNAQRLSVKTPCAKNADKCYNCGSAERICRVTCIFGRPPTSSEMTVVIINESLGY